MHLRHIPVAVRTGNRGLSSFNPTIAQCHKTPSDPHYEVELWHPEMSAATCAWPEECECAPTTNQGKYFSRYRSRSVRLVVNAHRAELIQDVLPEQTVKMNSEMLCQLVRFRAERCQRFRDPHAIGPPAKRNPSGGAVQTLKQFQPRPVLSNEPNGMISSSKEISSLYAIREARHS